MIRCYSRAGQLALVGMAVLAGYGAARVLGAHASRAGGSAPGSAEHRSAAAGLQPCVTAERSRLRSSPRSTSKRCARRCAYREFPGMPAIYDVLRDEPQAVVIELPFYGRGGFFGNARYMINATRHRHPLVNGYSGFAPPASRRPRRR